MGICDNVAGFFSAESFFSAETTRNKIASLIAGFLFFSGWWVLIDAMSVDPKHQITTAQVFIGVFATVSFFMVNSVKNSTISEENTSESGARFAKIWFLIALVMGFATIIAAVWVMIDDYIRNEKKDSWLGVALLMQNFLILLASLVYKFGRNEEIWAD